MGNIPLSSVLGSSRCSYKEGQTWSDLGVVARSLACSACWRQKVSKLNNCGVSLRPGWATDWSCFVWGFVVVLFCLRLNFFFETGCPGTPSAKQAYLKLTDTHLPLPPKGWD